VRSFVQFSRKSILVIGITAALGSVPSAALATAGARTPVASQPAGKVLSTTSQQYQNVLTAVAARSSAMAWAVGWWANASAQHSLIERWNGKAWKIVPSPNPAGVGTIFALDAVDATSSSNAWAVGGYGNDAEEQNLIYHWNGRAWKQVRSPDPAGRKGQQQLLGVAASSASSAWAVGVAGLKPLIEHWNGRAWKQVASPSLRHGARAELTAVAAPSSSNAWAVGDAVGTVGPLIEHWNGKTWKLVRTPDRFRNVALEGVTATSASNVWTVGTYVGAGGVSHTLSEHWNGHGWKIVPIAKPGGTESEPYFYQVAAASPKDVWAVGSYGIGIDSFPVFEHWNGKAWKQIPAPDSGFCYGVAAVSATTAWAVGAGSNGRLPETLIEQWNGKAWARVPSPNK
jgi:hypothetical protein